MASKRKRTQATEKTSATAASATEPVEAIGAALVGMPEEPLAAARRVSTRSKKKVVYTEEIASSEGPRQEDRFESPLTEIEEEVPEDTASPNKKRRRKTKTNEPEVSEDPASPKMKRRRKTKTNEPVVYDIPPVETKTSTFKGRLGYACLNTILRVSKPDPVFCSRTLRIDTILKPEFGMDYCKELGRKNAEDLSRLIQWNEENNIKFLRMSSEMFPFASHGTYGYTLEYAEKELKAAGDLARKYGHRLTSHPGQFTQLGSPREVVVVAAIRDLQYHCEMFRLMGLDQDSVMIIHMGGMFGDKQATIERFREVYKTQLTDEIRARLVLENDEMCYNPDDLLPVCEELDIPLVFDYHHNWIYPSEKPLPELIERINAIWHRKGIKPKQHLSEPCPGAESVMEKRKHADRCKSLPEHLPDDMDLMIEAKDKEQAVFHLYRIYNLHPVVHENLRPEKPPKPFSRAGQADGDGQAAPRKRKRSAATKTADDAVEEAATMATGVSNEPKDVDDDGGPDVAVQAAPKTKKKSPKVPRKRVGKSRGVKVAEEESTKVEEMLLGTTGDG